MTSKRTDALSRRLTQRVKAGRSLARHLNFTSDDPPEAGSLCPAPFHHSTCLHRGAHRQRLARAVIKKARLTPSSCLRVACTPDALRENAGPMGRLRRDGDDSTWRARMRRGLARSQIRGHEVRAEPQYADGHPA